MIEGYRRLGCLYIGLTGGFFVGLEFLMGFWVLGFLLLGFILELGGLVLFFVVGVSLWC